VSLLLTMLGVASVTGGALLGRWLGRRTTRDAPASARGATKDGDARPSGAAAGMPGLDGFPCQLGDVLFRITGEEAWLAGGVVLSEELPVAVLFVAPEAGKDRAIYVRPAPKEALFWLEPLDPGAVLVGGEPPSAVEEGGIRFERIRRLPLRPRRIGVGAPDLADAVVVAEYASAGALAYRGVELGPASYEVVASGRSTLDDA